MTRLFIPACGDRLVLASPWTFNVFLERRNMSFAREEKLVAPTSDTPSYYGVYDKDRRLVSVPYTFPEGTILECDRVYIRIFNKSAKNVEDDFDSITWRVIGKNGKQKKNCRFWAKLSDCNTIDYELASDASYKIRAAAAAEAEVAKPERLSIDEIRHMIRSARIHNHQSELGKMFQRASVEAMRHFDESLNRDRDVYDEYVRKFRNDQRDRTVLSSFSMFADKQDKFEEMTKQEFLDSFFRTEITCKFTRRPDNTCSRRMSHPIREMNENHYWRFDKAYAMSGLSYSIITDANDQKIIGIEVCKERSTK